MFEFEGLVEIVLDDVLVATGHEDEVLDACFARFIHDVLDRRTVEHRQHFLRHGLGGGQYARSETGDGQDGLLLVGDSGGMVNPFNGEGIAYAMESGRTAAEVIAHAFARADAASRERVLQSYNTRMKQDLGGYYTLGRHFATIIGHPDVMRLITKYGLPRTTLMKFMLKTMANLAEPGGKGASDRLINALSKITPAA